MESRDRILEAAARVYAETGFRGATTRRIADEAGVNEITIFRQFGSKAALIDEALRRGSALAGPDCAPLPVEPSDPEAELTAWCAAHLEHLHALRSMMRKSMSELEERPSAGPCATAPMAGAARELKAYMQRMRAAGLVEWGDWDATAAPGSRSELAHAAGAMLMGALFADAMGRDFMREMYPQPPERAPALYVRLFLRAIGARPRRAGRRTSPAVAPAPDAGRARPGSGPRRRPTTPPTKER